jgi:hypothetical protein
MNQTQIFVSFDVEHDRELFEALRSQSSSSGFNVLGCSERHTATDVWNERARRRIRDADQVIFICSEHTEASASMSTEIRIAQQEQTPYFLLWGRPEIMCTKPAGAKSLEGMYKWTSEIVQYQITLMTRKAHWDTTAGGMKRPRIPERSGGRTPIP